MGGHRSRECTFGNFGRTTVPCALPTHPPSCDRTCFPRDSQIWRSWTTARSIPRAIWFVLRCPPLHRAHPRVQSQPCRMYIGGSYRCEPLGQLTLAWTTDTGTGCKMCPPPPPPSGPASRKDKTGGATQEPLKPSPHPLSAFRLLQYTHM